jgi:hypothetical protein
VVQQVGAVEQDASTWSTISVSDRPRLSVGSRAVDSVAGGRQCREQIATLGATGAAVGDDAADDPAQADPGPVVTAVADNEELVHRWRDERACRYPPGWW